MDQIGTVELSAYFILASLLFFPENSSFPRWILPQVFSQPASRSGSQPGTPLSASPPCRLTSVAGEQKLRDVRWISSKTHSSVGKSVPGPPLETGSKCETAWGTWKQSERLKRGEREFKPVKAAQASGPRCAKSPLVETRVTSVVESFLWSPFLSVKVPTWRSLSVSVCLSYCNFLQCSVSVSTAASSTHASLKSVSNCSANHGSGEAGRQTRNAPAPTLNTTPGKGEGEK